MNRLTKIVVTLFVIAFVGALASRCAQSAETGTSFAAGAALLRGPAPAVQLEWRWNAPQARDAHWETGVTLIAPSSYQDKAQTQNFALNATYVDGFGHFDLGLGSAYLQNADRYNGSHLNFNLLMGVHYGKWFVRYNHFSNCGTKSPNLGRDIVLVGRVL